ncbi:6-phosphogluconate dehydrogenase C-terminal domain-like protein [Aspergillus violaceofuscus CBS 115571]|uniref:6-phosphogluconate dehydrogenase C-terminal domain-like protein n=1 Tax=Aspergillus violaceofuscus (strain CBS 115571) TaxID=1450538 RepID=A0A2V5HBQ2_ASPV1|nr:6-phosphogluconate dehydrogenase C-terminal domain-like protein [Aspergillus violaceofuscus CBS 115571]
MTRSPKVGIVSIGEMGAGIAKLLVAHGYVVLTNITGRSPYTYKRAEAASITLLNSDEDLVVRADYILSIVPPRDALGTAQRIFTAAASYRDEASPPLYYLDLNAVSPGRARHMAEEFRFHAPKTVVFIDGGILGGPPSPLPPTGPKGGDGIQWKRPAIPLAGPELPDPQLARVLNVTHLGPTVGAASGLKCCFGALIKGLIALSIQSFTTAEALGVYEPLQEFLKHFQPALQESTTRMITEIPPKAGRWVEEMWEIGRCFGEDGGWDNVTGPPGSADIYRRVAEVYRTLAEDTVLGQERPEHRVRGTTAIDVAVAIEETLKPKVKE